MHIASKQWNDILVSWIRERNFNRCSGSSIGSKKKRRDVFRDIVLRSIHHLLEHLPASPSSCLKHFEIESLHRLSLPTRRLKLTRKLFVVRNDVSNKSCTVSKWIHSAVICLLSSYFFSEILHSLSVPLYNTFYAKFQHLLAFQKNIRLPFKEPKVILISR